MMTIYNATWFYQCTSRSWLLVVAWLVCVTLQASALAQSTDTTQNPVSGGTQDANAEVLNEVLNVLDSMPANRNNGSQPGNSNPPPNKKKNGKKKNGKKKGGVSIDIRVAPRNPWVIPELDIFSTPGSPTGAGRPRSPTSTRPASTSPTGTGASGQQSQAGAGASGGEANTGDKRKSGAGTNTSSTSAGTSVKIGTNTAAGQQGQGSSSANADSQTADGTGAEGQQNTRGTARGNAAKNNRGAQGNNNQAANQSSFPTFERQGEGQGEGRGGEGSESHNEQSAHERLPELLTDLDERLRRKATFERPDSSARADGGGGGGESGESGESGGESGSESGDEGSERQRAPKSPRSTADNKTPSRGSPIEARGGQAPTKAQQQSIDRPPNLPSGNNDDIIARQLREAAEAETDPNLREKLWEEYRRYKGL